MRLSIPVVAVSISLVLNVAALAQNQPDVATRINSSIANRSTERQSGLRLHLPRELRTSMTFGV